ncbi:hypothetical protein KSP40_PGU008296 [Platanthera guangdongensis]|uniref:Uncharacterized protein n=1 Tax=Platanthera guangdongensis TaxID=2320717 RepID=A0ABR2MXD5_9ASPA
MDQHAITRYSMLAVLLSSSREPTPRSTDSRRWLEIGFTGGSHTAGNSMHLSSDVEAVVKPLSGMKRTLDFCKIVLECNSGSVWEYCVAIVGSCPGDLAAAFISDIVNLEDTELCSSSSQHKHNKSKDLGFVKLSWISGLELLALDWKNVGRLNLCG